MFFGSFMRIIATNTLKEFWKRFPDCEQALKEAERAKWRNPQELRIQFGSASIITGKRIVFNINGNKYRLIVDFEFRLGIIFIVWFGTHDQCDFIDSKKVSYVKADKNK